MADANIVVTGLGVWSAAGTTPEELWDRASRGHSPAAWHDFGGTRTLACVATEPEPFAAFPQAHRMDRSVRLALAAALPASTAARLSEVDPTRVAVLVGNSRGPVGQWQAAAATTTARVRPTQAAHTAIASLSGALSLALRARGPCLTISATCASAAHAIALGAGLLRGGVVDAVLAGGAEAPLVPALLAQFRGAGLLGSHPDPAQACRPFDVTRNGIVPGEGAGFLVLERSASAARRRVGVVADLAGWAMAAESYNRVAARPDGEALARTIELALAEAGVGPQEIPHVNAHGTGTRMNDAAEAAGLRRVFGTRLGDVAVTSTKPVTGHGFGATAAWEAILTVLALRHRCAPPTAGWKTMDPTLDLTPVHGAPRAFAGRFALSTSLGFWGNTAALVFARPAVPEQTEQTAVAQRAAGTSGFCHV